MIDITLLKGSPNTVMMAKVTTNVFIESVHHRFLYQLNRDTIPITKPTAIAMMIREINILTTQAQAISILSDKLISQSVYSQADS